MKKIYTLSITLLLTIFFLSARAQYNLGVQLSALKNTNQDISITGFGVHGRIFAGNNLALGANFRLWPKKYEAIQQGTTLIRSAHFVGDLAGMLEYYFGQNKIRPYIGADAGAYFTNSVLQIKDNGNTSYDESDRKTYFGIAPKIGLGMDVTGPIGFFAQIQYNALFGNARDLQSGGFQTKAIDKFWSFDVGAYLRLKAASR